MGAMLVNDRDVPALAAEFLLERGSPALGFEHLLAIAIGFDRHELQRDLRPVRVSVARNTAAMPPRPICSLDLVAPTR